ncbi:MAG: M56 family metallopeptidase [Clostridia bacterium]|nr:M56 family metallopeptidase [Clostridia bacterium]
MMNQLTDLFLTLAERSLQAAGLALAVLCLRALFRRAPKWIFPLLWGLVALKLLWPFRLESALCVLPAVDLPTSIPTMSTGNVGQTAAATAPTAAGIAPAQVAACVWLAGAAALVIYLLLSSLRLRRRVKNALEISENVYEVPGLPTAFVLGLLRPRVYLPAGLDEKTAAFAVAHERAHIRRGDFVAKPLGFLLLAFYWFNPVLWLGYALFCRDVELACDERVARTLAPDARADYALALVSMSAPRAAFRLHPTAFGGASVKNRVRQLLSRRRTWAWTAAVLLLLCAALAVGFLTSPLPKTDFLLLREASIHGNQCVADFDLSLGHDAGGGMLYAELWRKGVCQQSAPAMVPVTTESLRLLITIDRADKSPRGANVQLSASPDGGTELIRFELPETLTGWSFASYKNGQKLAASPGDDRVLAALGFDVGGGIRSMDCDSLTSDPSRLESADCLLVVRLSLQAETLPPSDGGAL